MDADAETTSGFSAAETSGFYRRLGERTLVSRLIGMETEYATLIVSHPELASADLPASSKVYASICAAIRRDQPTVAGVFDQDQMFLASGGAVTFESHPSLHSLPGGLVEIATPEVTSPDELLACQRSIDELVATAADEATVGLDLRVLKNSSDALGHVYGCQENYEAIVAKGVWLCIYRLCIAMLCVIQFFSFALTLPVLGITIAAIRVIAWRNGRVVSSGSEPNGGRELTASEQFETLPGWLKWSSMKSLRLIHLPSVLILKFVGRHVAFRPQRKHLTALLASRVAICGAGDLDHDGCYRLSPKAMAIDTLADLGSYSGERPVYVYGHWLGQFCTKSFLSLSSARGMFRRRQRLQIGLSDSNLSELAEYVKLASVSLVLDMIETGATKDFLTLKRPIKAIHHLTQDWNLVRRVQTSRGKLSALEIQRRYLKSAKAFVSSIPLDQQGESRLVVRRWQELLDVVSGFRRDARNVTPALGRVDWLSKRWMMDQLGENAEWVSRKKTDLRYHELSGEGYYRKLAATNPSLALISPDRIARRRRNPPTGSPATKRGWLIREFGDSDESVTAEWSYALLGDGKTAKRVEFD